MAYSSCLAVYEQDTVFLTGPARGRQCCRDGLGGGEIRSCIDVLAVHDIRHQ